MAYTVTVHPKPGFLHVKVTGDNTPETVFRYLADVRNACLQHNCSNVLIEENLAGPGLRIAEIFEIVEERSKNAQPTVQRIAYTDVNRDHDFTSMQFAETVAANRSMNVRVFRNVRDAEEWLIAEINRRAET